MSCSCERPAEQSFEDPEDCILGLDFGTTSLKCVVIGKRKKAVLASTATNMDAYLKDRPRPIMEQDPLKIVECLGKVMTRLPQGLKDRVTSVGRADAALATPADFYKWKADFLPNPST